MAAPLDPMSRDQLIKIGLSYSDALAQEDGKLVPFAPECERHENGMVTVGGKPRDPQQSPANPDAQMQQMMKAMAARHLSL